MPTTSMSPGLGWAPARRTKLIGAAAPAPRTSLPNLRREIVMPRPSGNETDIGRRGGDLAFLADGGQLRARWHHHGQAAGLGLDRGLEPVANKSVPGDAAGDGQRAARIQAEAGA